MPFRCPRCLPRRLGAHRLRPRWCSRTVRLSYAELDAHANQLAHQLRALALGPRWWSGCASSARPEMMVGLLAVLKAGAAYLPLDPDYPAERLAFMLADAALRQCW